MGDAECSNFRYQCAWGQSGLTPAWLPAAACGAVFTIMLCVLNLDDERSVDLMAEVGVACLSP